MTAEKKDATFEYGMLDNGIDFIRKGIDDLFEPNLEFLDYIDPIDRSSTAYKYGILHLFSGFLLLLKERLRLHLEESIYKGRLREVKEKLANGKRLLTVDLDEALERLELGPKARFSDEDLEIIRRMQSFRNDFEHYKFSVNRYQLWSTIVDFLVLIDRFLVRELNLAIETVAGEAQLLRKIQSIEEIWKRVAKRKQEEWEKEMRATTSRFTKIRQKVLSAFENKIYREKGAFDPYMDCPECYQHALIVEGEFAGICTNEECNETHPMTTCSRCGQATTGFDWEDEWCEECKDEFEYYCSKD